MKKIHNESGFSVVELLLVVIILVLLGFIGWYIYHTDHKTVPKNITTSSKTTTIQNKKTVSYFTITQWGVRAPYSGSLSLEYTISTTGGQPDAGLSSTQLDASDPSCKSDGDDGGVIIRYASTDMVQNNDGTNSGLTPSQYFSQYNISSSEYSHVGNYYYWYIHPNGICGSSESSQNIMTETDKAFEAIVGSFQAVPAN